MIYKYREASKSMAKRNKTDQFQERFKGKMSLIGKEGHTGLMADSRRPIQKSFIKGIYRPEESNDAVKDYSRWEVKYKPNFAEISKSVMENRQEFDNIWKKRNKEYDFPHILVERAEKMALNSGIVMSRRSCESVGKVRPKQKQKQLFYIDPKMICNYNEIKSGFYSSKDGTSPIREQKIQVKTSFKLPCLPTRKIISGPISPGEYIKNDVAANQKNNTIKDQQIRLNKLRYRIIQEKVNSRCKEEGKLYTPSVGKIRKIKEIEVLEKNKGSEYPWFSPLNRDEDFEYEKYFRNLFGKIEEN